MPAFPSFFDTSEYAAISMNPFLDGLPEYKQKILPLEEQKALKFLQY